jgi:hypothetical protein
MFTQDQNGGENLTAATTFGSHFFRFLYQLNRTHYTGFGAKVKPRLSS